MTRTRPIDELLGRTEVKFGRLSDLTKGFSPERWTRVEKIMTDMQEEEDRQVAAESRSGAGPHAGRGSGNRPGSAVTGRPAGVSKDPAATVR
jgi:hypothetical protein